MNNYSPVCILILFCTIATGIVFDVSGMTQTQPAKKWAMPDTLVIIFFVAILTSLATWVVPVGMFDSQEVQYQVDGQTKTRQVVDPHSFRILTNDAGEEQYHRIIFTTGDERPGLMNFPFEGLTYRPL